MDGHAPTDKEGSIRVFAARFALEEFEKQSKVGGNTKIRLAKDDEMANVQNLVWADIKDSEFVVVEDLTEERMTRRAETPGHVLKKDNDFT